MIKLKGGCSPETKINSTWNLSLLALKKTVFLCDEPHLPPEQVFNSNAFQYINIIHSSISLHVSFPRSLKLYWGQAPIHIGQLQFPRDRCGGTPWSTLRLQVLELHQHKLVQECWHSFIISPVTRPDLIWEGESTWIPDYSEKKKKTHTKPQGFHSLFCCCSINLQPVLPKGPLNPSMTGRCLWVHHVSPPRQLLLSHSLQHPSPLPSPSKRIAPLHKVTEKAKHAEVWILSMMVNPTEVKIQVNEHT